MFSAEDSRVMCWSSWHGIREYQQMDCRPNKQQKNNLKNQRKSLNLKKKDIFKNLQILELNHKSQEL